MNDFYQPLQAMVQKMADEGFMKQSYVDMLFFSDSLPEIVEYFATYTPPASKWTASQN